MFINRALIRLTAGCRKLLLFRISGEVVLYGFSLLRALAISALLNIFILNQATETEKTAQYIIVLLCAILMESICTYVNQIIGTRTGIQIKDHLREQLLDNILKMGPAYVNAQRSGQLVSTLVGKIEAMEPYYTTYLPNGIGTILWSAAIIIFLMTLNMWVALVCLLGILIVLFIPNIWNKLMFEYGEEDWRLMAEFQSEMLDNLNGMPTLKAFNANGPRGNYLEKIAWNIHHVTMKHLSISQIESGILIFGAAFGSTMSVGVAIWQAIHGNIRSDQLVTILFLITTCFAPAFSLIDTWHLGYHGLTAAPTVFKILDKTEFTSIQSEAADDSVLVSGNEPVSLSLDHLTFSYDPTQKMVLNDISLNIEADKRTALVGKSGSGKTTILQLIAGFYRPQGGKILVNGHPGNPADLRKITGFVWQEPYLFYGTVRENICVGLTAVDEEEMIKAAKLANIHSFVMTLPMGYDTIIGERGIRLSGGEKQRIAIARCFLRQPQFLILDEATSNLDMENENKIKNSLAALLVGRTSLTIAHRLSTIQASDVIYVIDDGKIVQEGKHDDLMEQPGCYRDMMLKQAEVSL